MIQRKPINRLGVDGPGEVKSHVWLKDFPWKKLESRELKAPFKPSVIMLTCSLSQKVIYRSKTIILMQFLKEKRPTKTKKY